MFDRKRKTSIEPERIHTPEFRKSVDITRAAAGSRATIRESIASDTQAITLEPAP